MNIKFKLLTITLTIAKKLALSLGGSNSGAWCADAEGGSGYGSVRCQCLKRNYEKLRKELDDLKADIESNRTVKPGQKHAFEIAHRKGQCPVCSLESTGGVKCADCEKDEMESYW